MAEFLTPNQLRSFPDASLPHAAIPTGGMKLLALSGLPELGPTNATPVISNARKFVIPVPNLGDAGEPLVYPTGHEKAGSPVTDYAGEPKQGRGLVFFNAKDCCWQAVQANGQNVIIVNGVKEHQAEALYGKIEALGGDPWKLSLAQIKDFIEFAQGNGLTDIYDSNVAFIKANMTPARLADSVRKVETYGYMKRDNRDANYAVFVDGVVDLEGGPSATAQKFADGAVIVRVGKSTHRVQPDVFMRDYRHLDGRLIQSVSELRSM